MNKVMQAKDQGDPDCTDFVVIGDCSVWLEWPGKSVLVYIIPDKNGLSVELVPVDHVGNGDAVFDLTLDSCSATNEEAEKAVEEFYAEEE